MSILDGLLDGFEEPTTVIKEDEKEVASLQQGEMEQLKLKQKMLYEKRREALNKIFDIKGSIRVFCRIRPIVLADKRRISEPVSAGSERVRVKFGGTRKDFEFDKVFTQEVSQDPKGLIEIEGLTEVQISDYAKAKWWYNKGKRFRSTSWTNVNEASSRSHCLTRINIFRRGDAMERKSQLSRLWMVDLGGSERLLKTGAKGLTLDEGRAINLSLSALADVIAALKRKRNSKLTQILKDSLGDGSKVLMLVHIRPSEEDVCETICSLNFAKRARAIESSKEIAVDLKKQKEKKIMELEEDIKEAEKQLQNTRGQIQNIEFKLSESKNEGSISPKDDVKEIIETPKASKKSIKRNFSGSSVPRFMNPTVASRQRQSTAGRDSIGGRSKDLRSVVALSSIQLSCSQSLSYSDIRIKGLLRSSNGKSRHAETNTVLAETPKGIELESKTSNPRSKMVTSSDPNLRVKLCRHRRRMSNLI
ncbi:hypothetical protein TanjilG_15560 [Lupinus angustifolius]|nr:hypothetical protein TanjilG_15560 [Lupinus angustifolius]